MAGKIIGLMRLRDEAEIVVDALDHLATFCDGGIFVYDDASTDATPQLAANHPHVRQVIRGEAWDSDRERAEFENRAAVLAAAQAEASPDDWFVYIDADERVEYDWERLHELPCDVIAVRMKLLDFYITAVDVDTPYTERYWAGPEFRYMLIAFRNLPGLAYRHRDQRNVTLGSPGRIAYEGWVRHYGKALTVARWERKCDYYASSFPKYAAKWNARRGRAVHARSDFGHELIRWEDRRAKAFLLGLHREDETAAAPRGAGPLRILLTNHHLQGPGGTESYTATLAQALVARGHNVTVYSKFYEASRRAIEATGARVVGDWNNLRQAVFDVAHVHHNVCACEVRYGFPELPIVLVSHGVLPFLEEPPVADLAIARYVAVSEEVEQRLLDLGVPAERLRIVRNLVDERRFHPPDRSLGERPRRAIVLSNRIDDRTATAILEACEQAQIECLLLGARFASVDQDDLPALLGRVDLVFTLGRGAIETMLCGRIPFVLDHDGGEGLVTSGNVAELMRANFSGRLRRRRLDAAAIVAELSGWRAEDGPRLREFALGAFGVGLRVAEIEALYHEAIADGIPTPISPRDAAIARAIVQTARETLGQANERWRLRERAAAERPREVVRESLAEALLARGWLDAARPVLQAMIAESPTHALAGCGLAYVAAAEGRPDEARTRLLRVLASAPDHPTARGLLEQLEAVAI